VIPDGRIPTSTPPEPVADVEFTAKLLGADGKIIDAKTFHATAPAKAKDVPGAAAALGEAFQKATGW
jgi:phospholipid/cholesterol/gamma-HCH transport system substrate-binding protein